MAQFVNSIGLEIHGTGPLHDLHSIFAPGTLIVMQATKSYPYKGLGQIQNGTKSQTGESIWLKGVRTLKMMTPERELGWPRLYLRHALSCTLSQWINYQGSFWPSENSAKTDRSKVNRCRTGSHEKSARTPQHTGWIFSHLISGMTKFGSKLAKISQLAA